MPTIDEGLLPYATETQARYLRAVNEYGSLRPAAAALGVHHSSIGNCIDSLRKKAARLGYAPGHFESGSAPGYLMGKVTVQRGPGGAVERTWERQSPDADREAALKAAVEAMAADLPRVTPIDAPECFNSDLANLYTLTDSHVGMLAWRKEGGADWDLEIAERTLSACFSAMIAAAPKAGVGIVNIQGDFLHFDGLKPVTPEHGHILDADSRFSKVVGVAIRIIRRVVDEALAAHPTVHLLICEGNHDESSSVWLRQMFAALYENEPRLTVNDSELPFYVYQHGRVMLAFHHGHKMKNDQLPMLFAAQYPVIWGATTKRYCHTGHRHHEEVKEHSGMVVTQHATLAARDAYAARGGWVSERQVKAISYHSEFGQVAVNTIVPEMLAA